MGKQARAKRERRTLGRLPVLPDPARPIGPWLIDPDSHRTIPQRSAVFWRRLPGKVVACELCYRKCEIRPGEAGWCKIRSNRNGTLHLDSHGTLGAMIEWPDDTFSIRPGKKSLYLAGTSCTSGCSFCTSTNMALHPDRLPWALDTPQRVAMQAEWSYHRANLHPESAIGYALDNDFDGLYFGGNEATLTFEWTYDTARLAKEAGLFVRMDTNCFTDPAAIEALAPYVDAIYAGVKGSCSDDFYQKRTRSPGAAAAVKRALIAWRDTGTHVHVADVVAPPHWVDDATYERDATAFYGWLAEHFGPLTPFDLRGMVKPAFDYSDTVEGYGCRPMLPRDATFVDELRFNERMATAEQIARAAGLKYAYVEADDRVDCHACGHPLMRHLERDKLDKLVLHTHNGRCDHCGAHVPIVGLDEPTPGAVA